MKKKKLALLIMTMVSSLLTITRSNAEQIQTLEKGNWSPFNHT